MPKQKDGCMTIEFLGSIMGHSEMYIKETDPAERSALAEQIRELIKKGHVVFLMQGQGLKSTFVLVQTG